MGAEIVPLQDRSVLRFIEQQVVVAIAYLFINERRVVVGYDTVQQVRGLPQQDHIVLLQIRLEMPMDIRIDAQQMQVVPNDPGAAPDDMLVLIMGNGVIDQVSKGVPVGKGIKTLPERLRLGRFENAGCPFAKEPHRTPALALEIFRCPAVSSHQRKRFRSDATGFSFKSVNQHIEFLAESTDTLFVGQDVGDMAHLEQERFIQEMAGHILQGGGHTPVLPLFHKIEGIVLEPAEQHCIGRIGNRVKHPVDHLGEYRLVVEFHAIGGILPDFAGERPHHCLEELVDSANREATIIVQHPAQSIRRLLRVRTVASRQLVERRDDPRLHLFGRLVGEGDGQDMLVAQRIALQQQVEVILGQPVRLAAARRSFYDNYRRLHRRLNGQYLQTSSLSAATKGLSDSRISSIRPESRRS